MLFKEPIINRLTGSSQKPWWEKQLEYILFMFAIFGIPAILYLATRELSERYSVPIFIGLWIILLFIFSKYYGQIKSLKRQIKTLLKHSDYSPKEKEEIMEEFNISNEED